MDTLLFVAQAALGIGFLIFIHELGHYLAARLAGIRVKVFSLGFGPRLLSFERGGTYYQLALVPVGGYVQVAGDDPNQRSALEPDDLHAKGYLARTAFFAGGVVMNLVFAMVVLPIVFHVGVRFDAPTIGLVEPGGAAWQAGLEPGDRVLTIDGKEIHSFDNLFVEIALAGGRGDVEVRYRRGDQERVTTVRPVFQEQRGIFELGVGQALAPDPLVVAEVVAGSAAAIAGLEAGDKILAVDGRAADGPAAAEALAEIQEAAVPHDLNLTIDREGVVLTMRYAAPVGMVGEPRLGIMRSMPVVRSMRTSPLLDRLGILPGDLVRRVDGEPFYGAVSSDPAGDDPFVAGSGPLVVEVERRSGPRTLSLDVTDAERAEIAASLAFQAPASGVQVSPQPDTPAERAGVLAGDWIVRVNGAAIEEWSDLTKAIQAAGQDRLDLELRRDDRTVSLAVRPQPLTMTDLGFASSLTRATELYQIESVGGAIEAGMVASIDLVKQLYVTLKRIATGDVGANNLHGIVTIAQVSYLKAKSGWTRFVYFLALLSINLAVVNLLPIPVLDGGHLLFLLIERIKGSPVSAEVLNYSQILGLVVVLGLLVFVTYNDILLLFGSGA